MTGEYLAEGIKLPSEPPDALKTAPLCYLDISHPMLARASEAISEEVADWLSEQGAGLGDVLRLYAGSGPEFADGLPKDVLVAWLKANDDDFEVEFAQGFADVRWKVVRGERQLNPIGCSQAVEWLGGLTEALQYSSEFVTGDFGDGVPLAECRYCAEENEQPPETYAFPLDGGRLDAAGGRVYWRGECRTCGARRWACTRTAADVRESKRTVLRFFPGVWVPIHQRSRTLTRHEYRELIDRNGPSASANLRTAIVTFHLDGGVKVVAKAGHPVRLGRDGDWHVVTTFVEADKLVPPEPATVTVRNEWGPAWDGWGEASDHAEAVQAVANSLRAPPAN